MTSGVAVAEEKPFSAVIDGKTEAVVQIEKDELNRGYAVIAGSVDNGGNSGFPTNYTSMVISGTETSSPYNYETRLMGVFLNNSSANTVVSNDISLTVEAINCTNISQVRGFTQTGQEAKTTFDKNVYIKALRSGNGGSWVNALNVDNNSTVTFKGDSTTLIAENYGYSAQTINAYNGTVNFTGNNVTIHAKSDYGVNGLGGGSWNTEGAFNFNNSGTVNVIAEIIEGKQAHQVIGLHLGNKTLVNVSDNVNEFHISVLGSGKVVTDDTDGTVGIQLENSSTVDINSEKLTINVIGTSDDAMAENYGNAHGINNETGSVNITSSTEITVVDKLSDAVGISSKSESNKTNLSGDVLVTAVGVDTKHSIAVDSQAGEISLGSQGKTVLLNGDVRIGVTASTKLNGTSTVNGDIRNNGILDVGGSLTVNGVVESPDGKTTLTNAIYAINGSGSELGTIDSKSSSTLAFGEGTYDVANLVSDDTTTVLLNDLSDATQITIAEKRGRMVRAASGVANDQFGSAQDTAKALQDKLSITNDTSVPGTTDDVLIEEGAVNNRLTAKVDANGNLSDVAETKNSKLDALGSVSALSAMTLRHEMNNLSKRMGELRDAPAGVGTWARYYGSEIEYGAQNLTSKNNTIQVGSDYTVGDWKVGVAANYTDGESSYDNGSADNKNYGFAVYGTWFVRCGAYVDLIAKYSRMDNDFALNGMNGSYENNAFNVSAETGYRFEFMDGGLFVEPQVGLSYGRIMGDDFTAQNGVRIEQDDYDSLIGRVGVRTGFKFPKDKGLIYARVSGLYDFQGEMNATATSGSARNTIEEDLGGAWLELGVGANFNWTDNTYSYIDIERTNGGDVKENYRFNVGIRHTF